nr:capsid protein [Psittaciform ambidensovirus]
MPLLYPGHNYLGPGNELDNGPPVDKADEIARVHDYAYHNADSKSDIYKSDFESFKNFTSYFVSNPNLPSFAGAAGIGAKLIGETVLGATIYPFEHNLIGQGANEINKAFGGSDWFEKGPKRSIEQDEAMKKQKTDHDGAGQDQNVSSTDGTNNNPQAGSSLPGGTGADVVATIIKNPHLPTTGMMFKKTWQFYTGAFQFNSLSAREYFGNTSTGLSFSDNTNVLLTPMAALDPGMLALYMSPMEYNNLPEFTIAKMSKIKVVPLGYRLPFQTNEATANFANSQTLVQIAHSVGLNTMYNMAATPYQITAADPTLVTATTTEDDYQTKLYGSANNATKLLGANIGKPTHINLYTAIFSKRGQNTDETNAETPNLIDNIQIQNVNDCKGTPIINFENEFKMGLLKVPNGATVSQRDMLYQTAGNRYYGILNEGVNQTAYSIYTSQVNQDDPNLFGRTGESTANAFNTPANLFNYNSTIEKSYWIQNQIGQHQTPDYTPFIHYGCMAVPNNPALVGTETFSPAVVQWEVCCELYCEFNLNSTNPYANIPYIKKWDPIYYTDTYPRNSGQVVTVANRRFQPAQEIQPPSRVVRI